MAPMLPPPAVRREGGPARVTWRTFARWSLRTGPYSEGPCEEEPRAPAHPHIPGRRHGGSRRRGQPVRPVLCQFRPRARRRVAVPQPAADPPVAATRWCWSTVRACRPPTPRSRPPAWTSRSPFDKIGVVVRRRHQGADPGGAQPARRDLRRAATSRSSSSRRPPTRPPAGYEATADADRRGRQRADRQGRLASRSSTPASTRPTPTSRRPTAPAPWSPTSRRLCDPFEVACSVQKVPNSVDTDTLSGRRPRHPRQRHRRRPADHPHRRHEAPGRRPRRQARVALHRRRAVHHRCRRGPELGAREPRGPLRGRRPGRRPARRSRSPTTPTAPAAVASSTPSPPPSSSSARWSPRAS